MGFVCVQIVHKAILPYIFEFMKVFVFSKFLWENKTTPASNQAQMVSKTCKHDLYTDDIAFWLFTIIIYINKMYELTKFVLNVKNISLMNKNYCKQQHTA